jgi:hypothetical protein
MQRSRIRRSLITDAIHGPLSALLPEHEILFHDASPGSGTDGISLQTHAAVRRAIEAADLVLIGGGELIGPHAEYLDVAVAAAAADVPTVWLGVGGRVRGGRLDRIYTRALLRRAEAIVTRDPRTFAHLSKEVPAARLYDGVDVAFAWQPPAATAAEARAEFGVCLRGPEQRNRSWDRETFARLAREVAALANQGLRPVFFTFLSGRDARRIGSPNLAGSFSSDESARFRRRRCPACRWVVVAGRISRVVERSDPCASRSHAAPR